MKIVIKKINDTKYSFSIDNNHTGTIRIFEDSRRANQIDWDDEVPFNWETLEIQILESLTDFLYKDGEDLNVSQGLETVLVSTIKKFTNLDDTVAKTLLDSIITQIIESDVEIDELELID